MTVAIYPPPPPEHPWLGRRRPVERLADVPALPAGQVTADRVADALRQGIADGFFRQGQQLPPYAAIGRRYGTSADTARTAVAQLAATGEVQIRKYYGAYVRAGRPAGG